MIIDLLNLEGSSHQFELSIPADRIDLGTEHFRLPGEISVKGEVRKHLVQADVSGTISAASEVDCSRCLSPVPGFLDIDFDVSYVTNEEFGTEREAEVQESDLETDVLTDDKLDIAELVREQILLNLPEQVFCKEECKGLCPKCGVNRNLINCNCEENEIDPRWSALKNLK